MNNNARPRQTGNFFTSTWQRFPIISTIVLIGVALFVLTFVGIKSLDIWTHHGETSVVPDVKGQEYAQAVQVLREADLDVVISDSIYDDDRRPGSVVEVWPKPGAVVKAGREVYVTIVAFAPRQIVIDTPLTDISVRQAVNYLNSHGITKIQYVTVPSEYPDLVVAAKCDGQYVTLGSVIPANSTVVLEVGQIPDDAALDNAVDAQIDSLLDAEPDYAEHNTEPSNDPIYD